MSHWWHLENCGCCPSPSASPSREITPGDNCQYCDTDTTPEQYLVTFSGLSLCTNCMVFGPTRSRRLNSVDYLNRSFIVIQNPSFACAWNYVEGILGVTNLGNIDRWNSSTVCSGAVDENDNLYQVQVTISKTSATNWYLLYRYLVAAQQDVILMEENWTVAADDCGNASVNNSTIICPTTHNKRFADNGGATIVPI